MLDSEFVKELADHYYCGVVTEKEAREVITSRFAGWGNESVDERMQWFRLTYGKRVLVGSLDWFLEDWPRDRDLLEYLLETRAKLCE